jgi:hypothetical protein
VGAFVVTPVAARANAVDYWSDIATQVAVAPPQSRAGLTAIDLAYVHIAIYDAVNAIDGRYSVFAVRPATNPLGASMEAATAAAAYGLSISRSSSTAAFSEGCTTGRPASTAR